jgi:Family of unknown function (DUF6445)
MSWPIEWAVETTGTEGHDMARRSIVVIDDFYEDPDAVRGLALSLDYRQKPGATYPGREAVAPDRDWEDVRLRLREQIDEPVDGPCPKDPPFPQGKFRIAVAADQDTRIDRVHVDQQRWSGIVYLTRDEDCHEGLALYRHRPTGSVAWPEEWFARTHAHLALLPPERVREEMLAFFRDEEQFERIGLIPMAYNRAILLMAQVFHGTGAAFGDDAEHGRLTQHFEFYSG